jgi:hypothetical protein
VRSKNKKTKIASFLIEKFKGKKKKLQPAIVISIIGSSNISFESDQTTSCGKNGTANYTHSLIAGRPFVSD